MLLTKVFNVAEEPASCRWRDIMNVTEQFAPGAIVITCSIRPSEFPFRSTQWPPGAVQRVPAGPVPMLTSPSVTFHAWAASRKYGEPTRVYGLACGLPS